MTENTSPKTTLISLPAIYSEGAHFQDVGYLDIQSGETIVWRSSQNHGTWIVKTEDGVGPLGRGESSRGAYRFGSHRMARVFKEALL